MMELVALEEEEEQEVAVAPAYEDTVRRQPGRKLLPGA